MKFRHFPLHPDTPDDGMTLEELFRGRNFDVAAAQRQMAELMRQEGLPYGNRTMTYNSRLAQELAVWADGQPGGVRIHDALFRAYFVEGTNIARVENLASIAEQVGLDADEARDVLESRRCREVVGSDWRESRRLGITGVPTFVIGNQGVTGAQPYEVLRAFAVNAGANRRSDAHAGE